MANDFDKSPYVWPCKKGLLLLLGLSPDATQEEYIKAWNEQVGPLITAGNTGLIKRLVATFEAKGHSYDDAWMLAKRQSPSLFRNPPKAKERCMGNPLET